MSPSTSSRFRRGKDTTSGSRSAAPSARSSRGTAQAAGAAAPGRVAQVRQMFELARQVDPHMTRWIVGVGVGVFVLCLLIGVLLGHPIVWGVAGVIFGLLAAALVMARRTDAGAYAQIEGKPGAALAALTSIRRGGWYVTQEPVAFDGRPQGTDLTGVATVYRAVGRPGVVLVGEGPAQRTTKLLAAERKKVERFAPGAPVRLLRVGEGEDATPVRKLAWEVQKMKPVMTNDEVRTVEKRLKALTGVRTGVPAGMDPSRARVNRSAMRGR